MAITVFCGTIPLFLFLLAMDERYFLMAESARSIESSAALIGHLCLFDQVRRSFCLCWI